MKKAFLSILFLVPLILTGLVAAPAQAATPTLSLTVSSLTPEAGAYVRFSGKVSYASVRNNKVRLQRKLGTSWSLVKRLPVSSTGTYSTRLIPPGGKTPYRVVANAASNGQLVVSPIRTVTVVEPSANPTLEEVRTRILRDTNAYRAQAGLAPLTVSVEMNTVAQNWSKDMAARKTMNHNPNYSSQIPAGWTMAGENVAMGWSYFEVTRAWYDSPGHRANLLGDYTHIGIGWANDANGMPYYTQVFAKY